CETLFPEAIQAVVGIDGEWQRSYLGERAPADAEEAAQRAFDRCLWLVVTVDAQDQVTAEPQPVSHMLCMAPGPSMSARVNHSPGCTATHGETFQPWPSPRAAAAPIPSVARPPWPAAPEQFSG